MATNMLYANINIYLGMYKIIHCCHPSHSFDFEDKQIILLNSINISFVSSHYGSLFVQQVVCTDYYVQ